jgi:hypothetical protein
MPDKPSLPGSAEGGAEAEGYLEVEGAVGLLPPVTQEGGDAVQALLHGVGVDVQRSGGPGRALTRCEVRAQCPDQIGSTLVVVLDHRAEDVQYMRPYVDLGRTDQTGDTEVVRCRGLTTAAESLHGGDQVDRLSV